MTPAELERLACDLANWWMRARTDDRLVGRMERGFSDRLNELEKATRGNALRCYCLGGKTDGVHGLSCPARRS